MARSLAISIVNTNQWDWLEPCLASLLESPYTLGPSEIVVLDNASTDGSLDRLAERFPDIRVIAERTRRGFGANHGIVAAGVDTDLVLFLNPDTLVPKGSLDRMAEVFDSDDRIVLAGGPILDPDGSIWRNATFPFPTPAGSLAEAVGLHRLDQSVPAPPGISAGVGWISGSALMVDRNVFIESGGFDPRYFLYFEETDLGKRLTDAGGLAGFHSEAPVVHEGRTTERALETPPKLSPAQTKTTTEFERSAILYMRKHHGRAGALIYRLALLIGATLRLVLSYVPALADKLEPKGGSLVATRSHHRRRVGVALRPESGVSIGDFAREWNLQHSSDG